MHANTYLFHSNHLTSHSRTNLLVRYQTHVSTYIPSIIAIEYFPSLGFILMDIQLLLQATVAELSNHTLPSTAMLSCLSEPSERVPPFE